LDENENVFNEDTNEAINRKNTPIDSNLEIGLDIGESEDVQLLKDLAPFTLPPFFNIQINFLSKAVEEVKHFLTHSLGQTIRLCLNDYKGELLDGSDWVETISKALPRVKKALTIFNFNFSKEQVEAIINNSLHLEYLFIRYCKLRKWCCVKWIFLQSSLIVIWQYKIP
jgi:hypothetical protein